MKTFPKGFVPSIDKVASVYSGKNGCACGCRGKHTRPEESARAVKTIYNRFFRLLEANEFDQVMLLEGLGDDGPIFSGELGQDGGPSAPLSERSHLYIIYFKA